MATRTTSVWINRCICAKGYLHPFFKRVREILFRDGKHHIHFVRHALGEAEVLVVGEQPIFQENRGNQVRAALFHERYVFVIDIATVFDGIDSGEDRIFDPERTMSMGSDFAAKAVRRVDDSHHFFGTVLLECGVIPF